MALSITCKRCGKTHEVEKLRGKEEQYVCPRCFFGDLSAVTKGEWTEVGSVGQGRITFTDVTVGPSKKKGRRGKKRK